MFVGILCVEFFLVSLVLFLGTLQTKQNLSSFVAVNLRSILSNQPIETAGKKCTLKGAQFKEELDL